jgi:hypothetical protein
MANNNYPIESSNLVNKIKKLEFVTNVQTGGMNDIHSGNFNNSLIYKKDINGYVAKVNLNGHSYKLLIKINGNRPNPKYEKMIKRCF